MNQAVARQRILNFSAFTAYQLTSLVMDKLEEKITSVNAKLVVIADIANLFMNGTISKEEIQKAYGQLVKLSRVPCREAPNYNCRHLPIT